MGIDMLRGYEAHVRTLEFSTILRESVQSLEVRGISYLPPVMVWYWLKVEFDLRPFCPHESQFFSNWKSGGAELGAKTQPS